MDTASELPVDPTLSVEGRASGGLFGWNISSPGDLNNDGYDDIVVGAPGYNGSQGRAYLFLGNPDFSGAFNISKANSTITGFTGGSFGWDLDCAGDVNGDGFDDIVIGSPSALGGRGCAHIFYGRASWPMNLLASQGDIELLGEKAGDGFGSSVSGAGDVNNDGHDDVIIGAWMHNGTGGAAYVYFGSERMHLDFPKKGYETGAPYVAIHFPSPVSSYTYTWGEAVVVNPSDNTINVTQVYFNSTGVWLGEGHVGTSIDGNGSVGVGWYDGDNSNEDIWWQGRCPVPPHSARRWRVSLQSFRADIHTINISVDYLPGPKHIVTKTYSYYSQKPDTTLPQVELDYSRPTLVHSAYAGNYTLLNRTGLNVTISGNTTYYFNLSVRESSLTKDVTSGRLSIVIPKQFTNVKATNPGPGWTKPVSVTGGGAADWLVTTTISSTITKATARYFNFSLRTPSGYNTNTHWILNTNMTSQFPDACVCQAVLELGPDPPVPANVTLHGVSAGERFGWVVARAGDIVGDGFDDVIIGSPGYSSQKGRACLFFGRTALGPLSDSSKANVTFIGSGVGDRFGLAVAGGADHDDDGTPDILVGAPGVSSGQGFAYLFLGSASMPATLQGSSADLTITGNATGDLFGFSVGNIATIGGDLSDEMMIGAPGGNGHAYIFYGSSALPVTTPASKANWSKAGAAAGDGFGHSISSCGKINSGLSGSILIGAPGFDNGTELGVGKVFVFQQFILTPDHLIYVSGDGQTGQVAKDLSETMVVRVVNATGRPVPDEKVDISFLSVPAGSTGYNFSESGSVMYFAYSNMKGEVCVHVHLGNKTGSYILNASAPGLAGKSGKTFINDIDATAICAEMKTIALMPMHVFPQALNLTRGQNFTGYMAKGYDSLGNLNLTWTPTWSTTNGLGTATAVGGLALTGFLAKYTAGNAFGNDNISVNSGTVSNKSAVCIMGGTPHTIVVLSGDNQTGIASSALYQPLVALVKDTDGFNVSAGVKVYFNITTTGLSGDGAFVPSGNKTIMARTASNGTARAYLRLDSKAGINNVSAQIHTGANGTVHFTANGYSDAALASLKVVPAIANVTANSTQAFNLKGFDKDGDEVLPTMVTWNTNAGQITAFDDVSTTLRASKTASLGLFIKAKVGTLEASAVVNIIPAPLFAITVLPKDVDVITGSETWFSASGADEFDNFVSLIGTVWETDAGKILESNDTDARFLAQGNPKTGGHVSASLDFVTGQALVDVIAVLNPPEILSPVPDVLLAEDCPPYVLDLAIYEKDLDDVGIGLDWYITDNDPTLYTITGEYSDDDRLVITPLPNMYGSDRVVLWLKDTRNYTDSQPLWINITPVNDPPLFDKVPDLVIRYDDPYSFDYEPYISDLETPNGELTLASDESVEGKHTIVSGLTVTYNYPKSFLDKEVYVVLTVSDGLNMTSQAVKVKVTENYVPHLEKQLPDVTLTEGETLTDVFDLDDYFKDMDGNSLYFTYGETHVLVQIDVTDHTVDISSPTEWYGVDTVTFRATDPSGALAEDTIMVTVLPMNDPPTISGVPDLVVRYDSEFTFDLYPYVTDIDNATSDLQLIFADPVLKTPISNLWGAAEDELIMHILFSQTWLGMKIPIRIAVSDGLASAYQDINVTVSEDWPPELTKKLDDLWFFEDQTLIGVFDLNEHFFDKDMDMLFYTYGNHFVNVSIDGNGIVSFSSPRDWFGSEYVTFRATDSKGALVESRILVTVVPVNDAPIISAIPDFLMDTGVGNLDLSQYITDVDSEQLKVTIGSGQKDLIVFVNGMDLVVISNTPQTITLDVNVTDSEAYASAPLKVIISGKIDKGNDDINWFMLLFILLLVLIFIIGLVVLFAYLRGIYKVEALFLVYKDGRMIKHIQAGGAEDSAQDEVLSGMFTAIQDLIDDTFSKSSSKGIKRKRLEFGDKKILIEKGRNIYLALILNGRPGRILERRMEKAVRDIEVNFRTFRDWDGQRHKLDGLEKYLAPLIDVGGADKASAEPEGSIVTQATVTAPSPTGLSQPQVQEPPQSLVYAQVPAETLVYDTTKEAVENIPIYSVEEDEMEPLELPKDLTTLDSDDQDMKDAKVGGSKLGDDPWGTGDIDDLSEIPDENN